MSVPYEQHETIDHSNPYSKQQYARIVREWKQACYNKVASPKSLRKGGRVLKRELKRKNCKVDEIEDEPNNCLIHEFRAGGRTISTLYVTFENFEREVEADQQISSENINVIAES